MNNYKNEYAEYQTGEYKSLKDTYKALSSEYPIINILFVIGIIGLIYSSINEIEFRMAYIVPPKYSESYQAIDISQEPLQIEPPSQKSFPYTARNGNIYTVIPMADYSISALVAAKNTNLWLRGIMNSDFDNIALMDFGLLCGQVANEETLKYIKLKSKKRLDSARELRTVPAFGSSWEKFNNYLMTKNLSMDYYFSHMSHVHVIPANNNVMSALIRVKKMENIKMDGYLVDLDFRGPLSKTSLSRTDTNPTSRGYGACEVMYVKSLQVGHKLYQ